MAEFVCKPHPIKVPYENIGFIGWFISFNMNNVESWDVSWVLRDLQTSWASKGQRPNKSSMHELTPKYNVHTFYEYVCSSYGYANY